MRGMNRLAEATERLMRKVDDEADKAASEVEAAGAYALDAVDKFRDQAGDMRRMADDILARLGQQSNAAVADKDQEGAPRTADALPSVEIGRASQGEPLPELKRHV